MTRAKAAATISALISVSAICGLFLTEGVYRALNGLPLYSTTNLILQRIDLIKNMTGVMVFDEIIGWRLKDNLFKPGVPFTTGEFGVRMNSNKIVPIDRDAVLAVGDSFTAGSGVRDEEAWPAQLESLLGERIINGSAGAYGVDQIFLRTQQLLPLVRPKTLLVGILSQDSLRNNYVIYGGAYKPYYEIVENTLQLKGVPLPRVDTNPPDLGIVRNLLGRFYVIDAVISTLRLQDYWTANRLRYKEIHEQKVGPEISCHIMEGLNKIGTENNIRVIMVMMYGAGEIEASPAPWFATKVVDCATAQKIEVVDTYAPFRSILKSDRNEFVRLWLDEGGQLGHLSAYGNSVVARLVRQQIMSRSP